MKSLGNFKIIKHKPKANIVYPLIRLPQSCAQLAGEQAYVFETEFNGKPLFLISLDEKFNTESVVVQPKRIFDLESRLEAVEKKLAELSK